MSQHQATHFRCDRCGVEDSVLNNNISGQMRDRGGAPDDWLVLRLGFSQSEPTSHLCPSCKQAFETFMRFLVASAPGV